ncbi:MAG: D-hexose-6-phosphate mutarotase [Paludibacterium sp.]|uniref:D-hexose-6-phosphate mutarotase n=1 Tax=Paludibacterium sp. TaxID=1917523 RepID=UPI00260021A2|nr:D-hexose-6-phosphate mutarotase [Paludibacterium sp.]MBV8046227.1 D-hexose-6-phosphate mutarotase [Paludibacterium sp.]MBV8649453.1 D-hexose-6-phosphate mutarotase [Paludibacterium sp.]
MTQTPLAPGAALRDNAQGSQTLLLRHDAFQAEISLDGGQLTAWQADGQPPLLYLSPHAVRAPGKAIRGGIPVCWPWFGPHTNDASQPQHGVARTARWGLSDVTRTADGFSIELQGPDYQGLKVESCLLLTASHVDITLTTHNHGAAPQQYSAALHTYLAIGHADRAYVQGLAHCRYQDKVAGRAGVFHDDTLACRGELDRIVYGLTGVTLVDEVWRRQIVVENAGSDSLVLWNPGADKARALKDLPDEGWRDFFCIEAANAEEDARRIEPGESHTLGTRLRTIPL